MAPSGGIAGQVVKLEPRSTARYSKVSTYRGIRYISGIDSDFHGRRAEKSLLRVDCVSTALAHDVQGLEFLRGY